MNYTGIASILMKSRALVGVRCRTPWLWAWVRSSVYWYMMLGERNGISLMIDTEIDILEKYRIAWKLDKDNPDKAPRTKSLQQSRKAGFRWRKSDNTITEHQRNITRSFNKGMIQTWAARAHEQRAKRHLRTHDGQIKNLSVQQEMPILQG